MRESPLQLRLLGPLELVREGILVTLPPSRTARALLGYLAATARPHGRDHLCDLLWDGPADPRASLRSALSRLRPLLDELGQSRLHQWPTRTRDERELVGRLKQQEARAREAASG